MRIVEVPRFERSTDALPDATELRRMLAIEFVRSLRISDVLRARDVVHEALRPLAAAAQTFALAVTPIAVTIARQLEQLQVRLAPVFLRWAPVLERADRIAREIHARGEASMWYAANAVYDNRMAELRRFTTDELGLLPSDLSFVAEELVSTEWCAEENPRAFLVARVRARRREYEYAEQRRVPLRRHPDAEMALHRGSADGIARLEARIALERVIDLVPPRSTSTLAFAWEHYGRALTVAETAEALGLTDERKIEALRQDALRYLARARNRVGSE